MRAFVLIILFLFCLSTAFTQSWTEDYHYKHFTGELDTNMQITFDLFAQNGKISGFYFYCFELPGGDNKMHYGKTIPLEGTLDGNRMVMHEFGNTNSKLTADFYEEDKVKGFWKRRQYEDPITFQLTEDYSTGCTPLNCFVKEDAHVLDLKDVPQHEIPFAKIDIIILYPSCFPNAEIKQSFDYTITHFMLNDSSTIKSPELLVENITFDYFQSYRTATNGIPNIEKFDSFNWKKRNTMKVMYNQNNILSVEFDKYGYTGGAHGVNITKYKVFNLETGKVLVPQDIFVHELQYKLNHLLDKKLRKMNGIQDNEALRDAGFFIDHVELTDNFYINNDGIGFFYNVYEIASFAAGTTELFCTFRELKEMLEDDHPFDWVK